MMPLIFLISPRKKMQSNFFTSFLSYVLLSAVVSLLFPIPKIIIASVVLATYLLMLISMAFSKPFMAFYFLVFFSVPIASFMIPSPISSNILPLFQLGIAVVLWGAILSLIASTAVIVSNYIERRSGRP
jgi:hypothetical protein